MDRQKTLMLFGAAWVSALLLTWYLYARTTGPKEEKLVAISVAARDMPLGTLLRAGDLKTVQYPEKNAPRGVVVDNKNAINHVVLYPLTLNEPILASKLST